MRRANERARHDRGTPSLTWHLSPSPIDCHLLFSLLVSVYALLFALSTKEAGKKDFSLF